MILSIAIFTLLYNPVIQTVAYEQDSSTGFYFTGETEHDEMRKPELRGSRTLSLTNGNNPFDFFNKRVSDGSIRDDEERELFLRRVCGDVERLFTSQYDCVCTTDLLPLQISYSCERHSPSRVGRAAYGTRYEGSFVVRLLETELSSPVSVCLTDVTYQAVRLGDRGRFIPFGNFCIEGSLTIDIDPLAKQVSATVQDCNARFGDLGTCTSCERCPNGGNGFYLDCPSMPGPLCLSNNIPFFGATVQTEDRDVFDALGLAEMMETRVNEMIAEEDAAQEVIRSQQQQKPQGQANPVDSAKGNTLQKSAWGNDQGKQNTVPETGNTKGQQYSSANKPTDSKAKAQNDVNNDKGDIPWWVLLTSKGGN